MDRRTFFAGVAGFLAAGVTLDQASARVISQAPVAAEGKPEIEEVRRGGRGRGRRVGWTRGRGKAWGRRRKFGW